MMWRQRGARGVRRRRTGPKCPSMRSRRSRTLQVHTRSYAYFCILCVRSSTLACTCKHILSLLDVSFLQYVCVCVCVRVCACYSSQSSAGSATPSLCTQTVNIHANISPYLSVYACVFKFCYHPRALPLCSWVYIYAYRFYKYKQIHRGRGVVAKPQRGSGSVAKPLRAKPP